MGTDNSSVALKWAPPAEDGGAPITNYVIEYKPVDAFRWLKANETQTVMETTFSVTGLKEGSQLEFRVAAQNKAGVGEASEPTKRVKVEAPLGKCHDLIHFLTVKSNFYNIVYMIYLKCQDVSFVMIIKF